MSWKSFDAVNRLKSLLGPVPIHPWSAIIPQLLLWCFRRYCIEKLFDSDSKSLLETLWEDHYQLIQLYAPKGLTNIASIWMTPDNLQRMHSQPEDYNRFFIEYLGLVDEALKGEDEELQDSISAFLDFEIREIFRDWLSGATASFLIYPMKEEDDNAFTDMQYIALIQSLLKYGKGIRGAVPKVVVVAEAPAEQPVEPPVASPDAPPDAPADAPAEVHPVESPVVKPPADPSTEPPADPSTEPSPDPPPTTVAEAIEHRKRRTTYRRHGRRANRGVTIRFNRVRANTRKVPPHPK